MRALLLVLACGIACGRDSGPAGYAQSPAARTDAPAAGELRVMSYNVNFGIPGDPAGLAAIADAKADLVFLQETNARWQAALIDALGERYAHRRFTDPPSWPAGGMGLLSRLPIVSLEELPSHGGPFFAWRVVIDTSLGHIQVLNVHLRPPMSDGGSWVVGFFSTRADRRREIQYHLEALEPSLPTLIVGDCNEELEGLAIEHLLARGYADAIATHHGTQPTWAWPVGSITLRFQLDHLLHDARWIAVRSAIVPAGRSDHLPIWADFARDDP